MFSVIVTINNNALTLNAANLGGNMYIDNLIGCSLDLASVLLVTVMMKKITRRNSLASTLAGVAFFLVLTPVLKKCNFSTFVLIFLYLLLVLYFFTCTCMRMAEWLLPGPILHCAGLLPLSTLWRNETSEEKSLERYSITRLTHAARICLKKSHSC